jgi:hypothetical protein
MIVQRDVEVMEMKFKELTSDQGMYIKHGKNYWNLVLAPADEVEEYIETDIPIGEPIPDETAAYAKAGRILMGVEE